MFKKALPQDFVKFGLIPEFIGRVPVVVSLDELDEDALVRILTEPKSAIVKQYKKLFEIDGVKVEFEPEALVAIAKKAIARNTGARGLRSIMEKIMMDLMFLVPSEETITECLITKGCVEGTEEPVLTYGERELPHKTKKHSRKSSNDIA